MGGPTSGHWLRQPSKYSIARRYEGGEGGRKSTPQSTHIGRDETGSVYLPTQLERTLQLYW
jgi:hypothetical protein